MTTGQVTTRREPDFPKEEKGVVLEKDVVGVSSLLAFVGRPKSSSKIHEDDAQGDGSPEEGSDGEEKEDEEERASDTSNLAFTIASAMTIICGKRFDLQDTRWDIPKGFPEMLLMVT